MEELPPIPELPSESLDKQLELKSAIETLQAAEDAAGQDMPEAAAAAQAPAGAAT